jgi:hypothetical protein
MPREVQLALEVQVVLQTLRTQRLPLPPQLLSTRQSRHTLFAESQTLVEQSALILHFATGTHALALQEFPVGQSESTMHRTHTPRVVSQIGSLEQSLLLLQGVKVTQRLPRQ